MLPVAHQAIFTRNIAPSISLTIRGPKKQKDKKAGGKGEISAAIINIYKDGEDPVIYPSDSYPPWVMEMLNEDFAPDDVMLQMMRGERLPTATE